jgi:adenylate cyclase
MAIFLSEGGHLLDRIMGHNMDEIWMRLIVLCLFIIFGSHAQFTINERREVAEKLERDKATRQRFQRLLSPNLAELVVSGKLQVEKGGESRVATVLFIDIRGFTHMSENMPADEVLRMLNEYFELVVDIVFHHEGTVDKFMGDGMMVIWGAPVTHSDDPVRAVKAALEIQKALVQFNQKRCDQGQYPLNAGIGINTGELVAGYIGSTRTMSYSVIGDTVNTASRLCGAAQQGQVLISEFTWPLVKNRFTAVALQPLRVKGKQDLLSVYEVLEEKDAAGSSGI